MLLNRVYKVCIWLNASIYYKAIKFDVNYREPEKLGDSATYAQ